MEFEILKHYRTGMVAYDRCHPPTIQSQWSASQAKLAEFVTEPSSKKA